MREPQQNKKLERNERKGQKEAQPVEEAKRLENERR